MLTSIKRLAVVALLIASTALPASAWPDKPIRLVIGFQAGGTSDATARYLGPELQERLGVQVVIDTNAGSSGARALEAVSNARDSHTFLLYSDEFLTLPLVNKAVPYRVLRELRPVALFAEGSFIIVDGPKSPFGSIGEFVKHAQANPGTMKFATSGPGTMSHMIGAYLSSELKLGMTHMPTRGAGGAINDLVDGKVDAAIVGMAPARGPISRKELIPLAVTSATRSALLPDVPTLDETIAKGIIVPRRYGIVAPQRLPDEIVKKMAEAVASSLEDVRLRNQLAAIGVQPRFADANEYGEKLREEQSRWQRFIEKRNLKLH